VTAKQKTDFRNTFKLSNKIAKPFRIPFLLCPSQLQWGQLSDKVLGTQGPQLRAEYPDPHLGSGTPAQHLHRCWSFCLLQYLDASQITVGNQ
jgi:hypothetical protein